MKIKTTSKWAFIAAFGAIVLIIGMLSYSTLRVKKAEARAKVVSEIVKVATQRRLVSEKALLTGRSELSLEGQMLHETLVSLLLTQEFATVKTEEILQEMRLNNVRSQQTFERLLVLKNGQTQKDGNNARLGKDGSRLFETYFALSDAIVDGAYRLESINRRDTDSVLRLNSVAVGISSVALAVLILVLFVWIRRHLVGRLTALTSRLQRLGQGNFEERALGFGKDEIGELADAFNDMAEQIWSADKKLRQAVEDAVLDLKDALRARDEFLSIASHELKTPITSLRLQTQLARRNRDRGDLSVYSPERVNKLIDLTDRQLDRITRLVDDMLDIARIRSGKLTIQKEKISLCKVIGEVVDRLGPNLKEAGTPVVYEGAEDAFEAKWDRTRMEQVVTNLLTNAMRYGNKKPVSVKLMRMPDDPTRVRLTVQDQGQGISSEAQERIFNRFERAIDANEVSGLGLGLFITRQIVEAHGGKIWVESAGKDQGSTFIVELPLDFESIDSTDISLFGLNLSRSLS